MTEFDPFAFLSWFVPLVVSSIIGMVLYITKNSWLRGKTEATTQGDVNLNQNMVSNAIREIERMREELKDLADKINSQGIDVTRLSERIKYISETLDNVRDDIRFMTRDVKDKNDKFDEWKRQDDWKHGER